MKRLALIAPVAALLTGYGLASFAFAQEAPPAPAVSAEEEGPMPAGGPDHPRPRGPMIDFGAIDTDGDGILSRAELLARAQGRLAVFDANADGWLDRDELIAASPASPLRLTAVFAPDRGGPEADRLLAYMGAEDDGRVEIVALAERDTNELLARADLDRDGAIARAEAARADGPRPDRREARGPKGDACEAGPGHAHGRG